MRFRILVLMFAMSFLTFGCAADNNTLKKENSLLKTQLNETRAENTRLGDNLDKCSKISDTLSKEKTSKDASMSSLRAKTRVFLRNEYDVLNRFSKNDELMDYIGGEQIERKGLKGSNQTLVDMRPLSANAVIYVIKGDFMSQTKIIPKLFRETDSGLICVWEGTLLIVESVGLTSLELSTPLNAMKGDFIGLYFPDDVTVPFDDETGSFSVYSRNIKMGSPLPTTPIFMKRSYSIGVSGLLD